VQKHLSRSLCNDFIVKNRSDSILSDHRNSTSFPFVMISLTNPRILLNRFRRSVLPAVGYPKKTTIQLHRTRGNLLSVTFIPKALTNAKKGVHQRR
jgi:hypothetical protein